MPRSLQQLHKTQSRQLQSPTSRHTSRYLVVTLNIVLQGGHTLQEQSPLHAEENTDLSTGYRQVMSLLTLGTMILILMSIHTHTTKCHCLHCALGETVHAEVVNNSSPDKITILTCTLDMHHTPDPGTTNHTEGALAANRLFVPEPTEKFNTGIQYNRLIHRSCAS